MSAAEKLEVSLEDLIEAIDPKWRSKIVLNRVEVESQGANSKSSISLAAVKDPSKTLDFVIQKSLSNVCQVDGYGLESELNTSAKMILEPECFINYPISSILIPQDAGKESEEGITSFEFDFSKAAQKEEALLGLRQFLKSTTKSFNLINQLLSAADELFTNAIFNAPFVDKETSENPDIDRTDRNVEMQEGHHATLFAGLHDGRVVIGCRDPFGTLNLDSLLSRIQKCYNEGVGQSINMGPGGAGIGSYLVFNTGTSYYVGIIRGKATVVCFSVPVNMSSKKRGQIPKNLHFFEIKQEGS